MTEEKPAMTAQQEFLTATAQRTPFAAYRNMVSGDSSFASFLFYELLQFSIAGVGGLVGMGLRSLFYPYLFKNCGKGTVFGKGMMIRVAPRITIGSRVIFDDYSAMDVRGEGSIEIEDHVTIARFTSIMARGGKVSIGRGVNISSYCRLATQTRLQIGESTLIAAYCYIGPGNHQHGDDGQPLISSKMDLKGGVKIGKHCWLGTKVTVVDGVTVGDGAIIGAHSLVKDDVPPYTVVAGVPAKVIREIPQKS